MNLQHRIGCLVRLGQAKVHPLDSDQISVFIELLADVPDDLLRSACERLAKTRTFGFPSVADILAMCTTVRIERSRNWENDCHRLHGGECLGQMQHHVRTQLEAARAMRLLQP